MHVGTVGEIWRYPGKSMAGEQLDQCSVGVNGLPGDRGWALRDEVAGEISGAKRWPALLQCSARYLAEDVSREIPPLEITLPDGSCIRSVDKDANERISAFLGHRVSLWPLQPASALSHYRRNLPGAQFIGWLSATPRRRKFLQRLMSLVGADRDVRKELGREGDLPMPDLSSMPGQTFEYASPPGTYFDAFPIHLITSGSLEEMSRANPSATWDRRRFRPNFLVRTDPALSGLVEAGWTGRRLRVGEAELAAELPTVRCSMTLRAQRDLPQDPGILRSIVSHAEHNLGLYLSVVTPGEVRLGDPVELLDPIG